MSNSYTTTPNDHTSERLSAVFPRACSGDMYAAVPNTVPAKVASRVRVGEVSGLPSGSGVDALANPKSRTLTTPSGVILILAGFKSR